MATKSLVEKQAGLPKGLEDVQEPALGLVQGAIHLSAAMAHGTWDVTRIGPIHRSKTFASRS
jgi:hypothetical protein